MGPFLQVVVSTQGPVHVAATSIQSSELSPACPSRPLAPNTPLESRCSSWQRQSWPWNPKSYVMFLRKLYAVGYAKGRIVYAFNVSLSPVVQVTAAGQTVGHSNAVSLQCSLMATARSNLEGRWPMPIAQTRHRPSRGRDRSIRSRKRTRRSTSGQFPWWTIL